MLTNCVMCGAELEKKAHNQKYCAACRHKALVAQQKAWREGKSHIQMGVCACCGRPLRKLTPDQKVHRQCDTSNKKRKKLYQEYDFKLPHRSEPEPPKYSIAQIDAKARELGTTYGKTVELLRSGKISME